jgi:hypothetical protein
MRYSLRHFFLVNKDSDEEAEFFYPLEAVPKKGEPINFINNNAGTKEYLNGAYIVDDVSHNMVHSESGYLTHDVVIYIRKVDDAKL